MNICAQHRLVCVFRGSYDGVKKSCTAHKADWSLQTQRKSSSTEQQSALFIPYSVVSPFGLLGEIRWLTLCLSDSLPLPLLKEILLIGFYSLQRDSKGISNGQVIPGHTLSWIHFPIIWYASSRFSWIAFWRIFGPVANCNHIWMIILKCNMGWMTDWVISVLKVTPAWSMLPTVVKVLKQYCWLKWSSLYSIPYTAYTDFNRKHCCWWSSSSFLNYLNRYFSPFSVLFWVCSWV